MTSCNKPYFNRLVMQLEEIDKFVANWLESCNKLVKLTTCNKSEAVFGRVTSWRKVIAQSVTFCSIVSGDEIT